MLFSYTAIADDSEHHLNDARSKLRTCRTAKSADLGPVAQAHGHCRYENLRRKILL